MNNNNANNSNNNFNRYTFRDYDGTYYVNEKDCYEKEDYYTGDAIERLAKYEDSTLLPELVQETAELAIWIHKNGLEKIKEWIKADKEGRLEVLPSNKALTNADRIRAMTNQQLAKLFYDNQKEFCRLMYKNLGFEDELKFSEDYSDILKWLNTSEKADKTLEVMKDE